MIANCNIIRNYSRRSVKESGIFPGNTCLDGDRFDQVRVQPPAFSSQEKPPYFSLESSILRMFAQHMRYNTLPLLVFFYGGGLFPLHAEPTSPAKPPLSQSFTVRGDLRATASLSEKESRLIVRIPPGKNAASFPLRIQGHDDERRRIQIEDYNFDGYKDISVSVNVGMASSFYQIFLFQPEGRTFRELRVDPHPLWDGDEICVTDIHLDPHQKALRFSYRDLYAEYRFDRKGNLQLYKTVDQTYPLETMIAGAWTSRGGSFEMYLDDKEKTILYEYNMRKYPYRMEGDCIVVDMSADSDEPPVRKLRIISAREDTLELENLQFPGSVTVYHRVED